jgi:hypothetical protein
MTESLTQMKITDVQAEYKPTNENEPIIWREDTRQLVIHEPDPFHAALIFLEWVASELPRQWQQVWESLQHIEKKHGREAAKTVLLDYISEMDKHDVRPRWVSFK